MKKLILLFSILLFTITGFAQLNDYINQLPAGHTVIGYKRIGGILYVYPNKFGQGTSYYSESYPGIVYYFSTDGNDANPGTKAEPKQTIAEANSLLVQDSTTVLFNALDTFIGTITPTVAGSSTGKVTVGSYGKTDTKAVIYGSDLITGWTLHSGSIWKATFATTLNQIFVDNVRMKAARYPNTGYALITTKNSETQFISTGITSQVADYYKDVKWISRTNEWTFQTRDVTASTGQTITIATQPTELLGVGEGFFFVGKLDFLDEAGEWYYDDATNTVYLWKLDGTEPTDTEVRGSTYANGALVGNGYSHVTIRDLAFLQQSNDGISTSGNTNYLTVSNCIFENADSRGIYIANGNDCEISNTTITGVNHYGIYANGARMEVANNTVSDISLFDNLGLTGMGTSAITLPDKSGKAMNIDGADNHIHHNSSINTAYSGISFFGANALVENNYVKNACLIKYDGGGLYTYGGATNITTPTNSGTIIRNNIVDGVIGTNEGFTGTVKYGFGIYLDNNSGGIDIENNTISHCSYGGIFLHINKDVTVTGNTVFDCDYGVYTSGDNEVNTITGNVIYALNYKYNGTGTQKLIGERYSAYNHTYNNNRYYNHYNNDDIFVDSQNFNETAGESYTFTQWKALNSQDGSSTCNVAALTAGQTQSDIVINSDSTATKTFYENGAVANDTTGTGLASTFTVAPFTAKILTGSNLFRVNDVDSIPLELETIRYMDGLAYQLTDDKINLIDNFVSDLKTDFEIDSLPQVFDVMYLFSGETSESGLRNLVKRSYDVTLSGTAPTYAKNQGYTGNASSAYLNFNFIPSSNAVAATLNSTSWGTYFRTMGATSTGVFGCLSTTADGGTANRLVMSTPKAGTDVFAVNAGLSTSAITAVAPALIVSNRVVAGTQKYYVDNVEAINGSVSSTKMPNQTVLLLARREADASTNYYGDDQVSLSFIGRGLTPTEIAYIDSRFELFLAKIGY